MSHPVSRGVEDYFNAQSDAASQTLHLLRDLVFEVAASNPDIGVVEETLKWGQPSYLTPQTKSGSTLRLATDKQGKPAIYINCQTTLADQVRNLYPDQFEIQKNRQVQPLLPVHEMDAAIRHVIALVLTYHRRPKSLSA